MNPASAWSERSAARQALDLSLSERQFQALVVEAMTRCGWLLYHTYDSRRSTYGFPDLFAVRGERVILAELKTMKGRLSAHQERWLAALRQSGRVEVYLWRPSDWDAIVDVLA